MSNFVVKVAFRYFSAKKNNRFVSFISTFSLLGVMLGVAALIVVMAVMEGFHLELTSNIIGLGGDISVAPAATNKISNYKELEQEILTVPGIKAVVPQVHAKALALSGENSSGVIVRGLEVKNLRAKPQIVNNVNFGQIADIDNGFQIAIGQELAANLRLSVGSELTLVCPNTVSTILGNLPRMKKFKIAAIFTSGMYDYDAATIIMSLNSAQKLFSLDEGVNLMEVYSTNHLTARQNATNIRKVIGNDGYVSTWYQHNAQFLSALNVERIAMFTILSLIIIVAAFNIISSLFMLVNEKTKDIAILKTMGASYWQILLIFILNGSLIGIIGTSLGVALGVGFATNIERIRQFLEKMTGTKIFEAAVYYLYHLPAKIETTNIIYVSSLSLLLTILATIYPAAKAASLDPAEALRNE